MAIAPLPAPPMPARSAFHRRISANTEAVLSLAKVAEDVAQHVEPRVAALEQAVPEAQRDIGVLRADTDELGRTRVRQDALDHLGHRVQRLEHLEHELKQLGHTLNGRIDQTAQHIRAHVEAAVYRIDDLAGRVKALETGGDTHPNWRDVALFAAATNGDGSFDERTTLGRLFLGQANPPLHSVHSVADLKRPGGRRAFIKAMSQAYDDLDAAQRAHTGPLTGADWGHLFDAAPELASVLDAMHPPAA